MLLYFNGFWLFFFFLSHRISGTIQTRKKKRKMIIVNLGGKRNHTHREKPPDASTEMHSPFRSELTQLSPKRSKQGGLGKSAETSTPEGTVGRKLGGLEGRSAACWKCLTACTPEAGLPSSAMSWQKMSLEDRCPQVFWMSGMDFLSGFLALSLTFPSSLTLLLSLSSPFGAHHVRLSLPAE